MTDILFTDQSEAALERRLGELDAEPVWGVEWANAIKSDLDREAALKLGHFAVVMSRWTYMFMDVEIGLRAAIAPERADELVARSRLLAEIKSFAPSIVTGPLDGTKQHWTTNARSLWNSEPPSRKRFIAPRNDQAASVKPTACGLYTSTASAAGVSMWRAWLGPDGRVGQLPWYTWQLRVSEGMRVIEIESATAWVEFVCRYARSVNELVYPDWVRVAREFDGVHFTLPAIVAAQGFHFDTDCGVIPPSFWDVETTLWLRWCVDGACLIHSEKAKPKGRAECVHRGVADDE